MFAVEANSNEMTNGFYVNICSVRDGDDLTGLDRIQYDSCCPCHAWQKGSSVGSPEEKWYAGNEGKWDDDAGDNLPVNGGLSDESEEYVPPGEDYDNSLFYSSKENH